MSPLARLLQQKRDNGLAYRQMERNAIKQGHTYSSSAFEQVAKDQRAGRLDIEAINAIAAGVGERPEVIASLDDARWGLPERGDEASPDVFRYQRPSGLTDAEWDQLRQQHADYWDYIVTRAAQER